MKAVLLMLALGVVVGCGADGDPETPAPVSRLMLEL